MSSLSELAQAAGLETGYHDIWGQRHEVPLSVQQRVLTRMGIAAADDTQVAQSLRELRESPWRQPLEPVTVLADGEPRAVSLSLPDAARGEHTLLGWRLEEESGLQHSGELHLSRLAVVERALLDGQPHSRYRLPLPDYLAHGYHRLHVGVIGEPPARAEALLILTPARCHAVAPSDGARPFGVAAQLYALRETGNWGIGSYSDIGALCEAAREAGAALVGLNPLHAGFAGHPHHISPYSPTSRHFLNALYIDVEQAPGFEQCKATRALCQGAAFTARQAALRAAGTLDYRAVWELKRPALGALYHWFTRHHRDADSRLGAEYRAFCARGGEPLRRQALFEALHAHFEHEGLEGLGWKCWPAAYQRADSEAVAEFAERHYARWDFWRYLQWLAERQLAAAAERAAPMAVGLYLDLAVGSDANGADVWADPLAYVPGLSIGAPPDKLSPAGQVWGLTPLNPLTLRRGGYRAFVQTLRASMRHAGALRIDHVLGLLRQFWVLDGERAEHGVYVHQPIDELLKIVALESQRARCAVIGEALGTVPEGLEQALAARGLLSYKVLYFERWPSGLFKRPDTYPQQALATISTHDLPPLSAWWAGTEIDLMAALGHFPDSASEAHERRERAADRQRLLDALCDAGLLAPEHGIDPRPATHGTAPPIDPRLAVAAQGFLADTPCALVVSPVEDLIGSEQLVNLPGTVDEHPNWRHRLAAPIAALLRAPAVREQLRALGGTRAAG